jgi:hypothetical protein
LRAPSVPLPVWGGIGRLGGHTCAAPAIGRLDPATTLDVLRQLQDQDEAPGDDDMQRTTVLTELPDSLVEEAAKNYRRA